MPTDFNFDEINGNVNHAVVDFDFDAIMAGEPDEEKRSLFGFVKNVGSGVVEAGKGLVTGIPQVIAAGVGSIADPGRIKEQAYNRRTGKQEYAPHLGDVAEGLKEHYKEYIDDPIGKAYRDPVGVAVDLLGIFALIPKVGGIAKINKAMAGSKLPEAGELARLRKALPDLDQEYAQSAAQMQKLKNQLAAEQASSPKIKISAAEQGHKVAPQGSFMSANTSEQIREVRLGDIRKRAQSVAMMEKERNILNQRLRQNITVDEANVIRSKVRLMDAKLDIADPVGIYRKLKSEKGSVGITSEDLSRVGAQMEKYNLWARGMDKLEAWLKTTSGYKFVSNKVIPKSFKRFFLEHYNVPDEFLQMSKEQLFKAGIEAEDGILWAKQAGKKLSEVDKETILKQVTKQSRRGVEELKGTNLYDDAKYIEDELAAVWKEIKDLGMSESEFFEGRYLPKLDNKNFLKELIRSKRKYKFSGRLQKRGASREVSISYWEKNKAKLEPEGWEVSKNLPDGRIQLRKFEPYGDIKDPYVLFAKGMADLKHDVAIGKMIKSVTENKAWAKAEPADGFIRLRDINSKYEKIGGLRDLYIQEDIARELAEIIKTKSDARKIYDASLALWKSGKTILNPPTHMRNLVGNTVLTDLGGTSMLRRPDIFVQALREMVVGNGKFFQEAKGGGLFGVEFYQQELAQILNVVGNETAPLKILRKIANIKPIKSAGRLYQAEEQWFKLAKFTHNRQKGLSVAESVADAQKWLFDYSSVSPFVGLARRTVAPFITFPAKALPRIIETAIKHPLRIGKYLAAYKATEEFSKWMLSLNDEEYKAVRENAPDYIKNGGMWILLPEKDKNNNFQFLNMTYFMPWGDLVSGGSGNGLPGFAENLLIPSTPVVRVPFEVAFNKSVFTGRKLKQPEESVLSAGAKYVTDVALPPLLGYQGRNIKNKVIDNEPNYFGEKEAKYKTVLGALTGLKATAVNPERERRWNAVEARNAIDELRSRIVSTKRNKSLSKDEQDERIEYLRMRIAEISNELRESRKLGLPKK